ncbi:hypothetical protein [Stieleria neptunia]|uniref:hypothetical protein n=1 Tax=Stieleria neptunia TaxID=2527979 RepID=UPI0018D23CD6|nr:hypothetical protein [Stieleria neptunia]
MKVRLLVDDDFGDASDAMGATSFATVDSIDWYPNHSNGVSVPAQPCTLRLIAQ